MLHLTATIACAAGTRTRKIPAAPAPPAASEALITVNQQGAAATAAAETRVVAKRSADHVSPPALLSIIPSQGEPGTSVILSGPGFNESTTVWLGTNEIPTRVLGSEQISFEIPLLPSGVYALFVKNSTGVTSKTYSFNLLPRKPIITELVPETLVACSQERDVTIRGKNFSEGAVVLFDGAAIRNRFVSPEQITVSIPAIAGGLHHVQLKNPDETVSTTMALMIDAQPEITSVSIGNEEVNFYELHIRGRNFQQGSNLIVDGRSIGTGIANPGDRDLVIYMDCNHLIYQRYPFSPVARELRIQVVNKGGAQSSTFTTSAP